MFKPSPLLKRFPTDLLKLQFSDFNPICWGGVGGVYPIFPFILCFLFQPNPPLIPPFSTRNNAQEVGWVVLGGDLWWVASYSCYLGRFKVLKPLTQLFQPKPPIIPPFPPKIMAKWAVEAVLGGDLLIFMFFKVFI